MRAKGVLAWETPDVRSFDDWLTDLYQGAVQAGVGARQPMSPMQEQALWQRVVSQDPDLTLENAAGAARDAAKAWRLVCAYRLPDLATVAHPVAEVRAFASWLDAYRALCEQHGLVDQARLPDLVAALISADSVPLPSALLLVGFDELTPQHNALLSRLEAEGVRVSRSAPRADSGRAHRTVLPDTESEYVAAARYAARQSKRDPDADIAILIDDLGGERQRVTRIFDRELDPQTAFSVVDPTTRQFNVSVGETLRAPAIIRCALALIRCQRGRVHIDDLGDWFRSAFVRGGQSEAPTRARFDAWLRARRIVSMHVTELPALYRRFAASASGEGEESPTLRLLDAIASCSARDRSRQTLSTWCAGWEALLEACGWPGDQPLDSARFQTVERWRQLLAELGELDDLVGAQSISAAVSRLGALCSEIRFQPRTPDRRIQIMRPDQVIGLAYDHVWWCGVHASGYPRAVQPNPFLPREWSRQYALPGAHPECEFARAVRLRDALCGQTSHLIVSTPREVDQSEVAVAPLVMSIPEVPISDLAGDDTAPMVVNGRLERVDDGLGPPVAEPAVRGGASVLAAQAGCPFCAFVAYRLHATTPETPRPGFDAAERGVLAHRVLQQVWSEWGSQHTLVAKLSEDVATETDAFLARCADRALDEVEERRCQRLPPRLRALERARLIARTRAWLGVESTRPPFTVVATEQRTQVAAGRLFLTLSIDRVDRIEDGHVAVIDYKTGEAKCGDWFGERPAQPQLPLYALAQSKPVGMVAFGLVRVHDPKFNGVEQTASGMKGLSILSKTASARGLGLSWSDLVPYWRDRVDAIANEFALGHAEVAVDGEHLTRLRPLCRAHAAALDDEDGDQ